MKRRGLAWPLVLALTLAPHAARGQTVVQDAYGPLIRWQQPNGMEVTPIHAGLLPDGRVYFINTYNLHENPGTDLAAPGFDPVFLFVMTPTPLGAAPPATVPIDPIPNPPPLGRSLDATGNRLTLKTLVCGGHALMADGSLFFASGSEALVDLTLYRAGQVAQSLTVNGIAESVTFHPSTQAWTRNPDTRIAGPATGLPLRWYSTVTRLADSRMLVTGGYEKVVPAMRYHPSVEVFDPQAGTWSVVSGIGETPGGIENPDYTHVFQLPHASGRGKALVVGGSGEAMFLTLGPGGGWQRTGKYRPGARQHIDAHAPAQVHPHHGATAAMLPIRLPESGWGYTNGSIIVAGGDHHTPMERSVDVYDPGSDSWRASLAMHGLRHHGSAVLLPDGRVLLLAGHDDDDPSTPGRAEYVDPRNGFSIARGASSMPETRGYHSVAVLLPDGRVLVGSGNRDGHDARERDDFRYYHPDYIGRPRPQLDGAPASLANGAGAFVTVPYGSAVEEAALLALGSHTHSFDMGQRHVQLRLGARFTVRAAGAGWTPAGAAECLAQPGACRDLIEIESPDSNETAPPGHYMLFVLDGERVPSPGRIVRVDAPRAGLVVEPASIAFGGHTLGTTSLPRTVTLRNPTASAVQVALVALAGGPFGLAHDCGSLAPGASCTATLTFVAAAEGLATSTLTVVTEAGTHRVAIGASGERSLVPHYYAAILGREPDDAGRLFWTLEAARVRALGADVNETWFAMAQAFFATPEYASFARTTPGYLRDLYRTFFNREPDAAGLAYWLAQVDAGMPPEVVLVGFMFSPEFADHARGLSGDVTVRSEVATVMDFYRGLLARLPDDEGFRYWVGRFRAAQCSGPPAVYAEVEAISAAFLASAEARARGRSHSQYVADLYNAFMRRGGDLDGVRYWIGQLATGARSREEVRRAFIGTPEFGRRVAAMLAEGCLR